MDRNTTRDVSRCIPVHLSSRASALFRFRRIWHSEAERPGPSFRCPLLTSSDLNCPRTRLVQICVEGDAYQGIPVHVVTKLPATIGQRLAVDRHGLNKDAHITAVCVRLRPHIEQRCASSEHHAFQRERDPFARHSLVHLDRFLIRVERDGEVERC